MRETDKEDIFEGDFPAFYKIPPMILDGGYFVDVSWKYLQETINGYIESFGLVMIPDFQRGHVWTDEQRIAFVEFKLRGGRGSDVIYFNHPDRNWEFNHDFVIVDGLQRITAVLKFMNNEIPAFGYLYDEYDDELTGIHPRLKFNVNSLKTREEVLQWYLDINSKGTPHTKAEIERVRKLLEKELK